MVADLVEEALQEARREVGPCGVAGVLEHPEHSLVVPVAPRALVRSVAVRIRFGEGWPQ